MAALLLLPLPVACSSSESAPPATVVSPVDDAGTSQPDAPVTSAPTCDPFEAKGGTVDVLVGPTDLEKTLVAAIDGAKTSLDLEIGELDGKVAIQALVAAKKRGVAVRVVLDKVNSGDAKAALGAEVVHEPRADLVLHAKVMVVDAKRALIGSSTLGTESLTSERTFATFVEQARDVDQLRKLVEHDWNATAGSPTFDCTQLVLSPTNARERVLSLVDSASETLDLELSEVSDDKLVAAIKARAGGGAKVRVLLSDPGLLKANVATGAALVTAGVDVRFFRKFTLRSSLGVSERAALIGSHTFTAPSLDTNRDVSVFVSDDAAREAALAAFEADWATGTPH